MGYQPILHITNRRSFMESVALCTQNVIADSGWLCAIPLYDSEGKALAISKCPELIQMVSF